MKHFKSLQFRIKIFLVIQATGMLMGTITHITWVINNGFNSPEYNTPLFSRLFWDSLTFLDPSAAILLFLKPKFGIFLTVFIITIDVIHNNTIYFQELYNNSLNITEWITNYWMIIGQIVFMIFVLITFRTNFKDIRQKQISL